MANDSRLQQLLSNMAAKVRQVEQSNQQLQQNFDAIMRSVEEQPKSVTEEIDSIPGRRIFYNLSDRLTFDTSQDGRRGDPLNFLVSQDGAFIMTHFPLVTWKPSGPADATNFGRWRPVSSWPLPTQQLGTDIIDLSYEMVDGGAQRNFQNEPAGAGPFSRPDNLAPLPVPTLFAPNAVIQFFPTFENILFDTNAQVPTTQGELSVVLIGYRIVNL